MSQVHKYSSSWLNKLTILVSLYVLLNRRHVLKLTETPMEMFSIADDSR